MDRMQVAFPLDGPLFTAGELADVAGLNRATVDLWVSRGLLVPTRREHTEKRARGRVRKGPGRPLFSSIAIFQVRLAVELGRRLGMGLSEWMGLSKDVPSTFEQLSEAVHQIAEANWFWAVARAFENGKAFKVYTYATYANAKWTFDISIGERAYKPSFPEDASYLVIPTWKIYERVYSACKKLVPPHGGS